MIALLVQRRMLGAASAVQWLLQYSAFLASLLMDLLLAAHGLRGGRRATFWIALGALVAFLAAFASMVVLLLAAGALP